MATNEAERDLEHDAADTSLVDVSENRVRVLRALEDQRRTVSELARELDLNKSTVHGYMEDLREDGLVERYEHEDRLWVYYSLTELGERFVSRERLTLVIDLATVVSFLGAVSLGLYRFLNDPEPTGGPGTLGGPDPGSTGSVPWLLAAYLALALVTVAGAIAHVAMRKRQREVLA
jgi:DNA-binding transcriptional ArsR family regulator